MGRKNRKLEAVIFDMDGVIVDSEPLWSEAENRLLARRNLEHSPELKAALMGRNSIEAVSCLKKHFNLSEPVGDLVQERNELVAELFRESLQPVAHVLDLIRSLRDRGVKTALGSSSPQVLVGLVLDILGIAGLFDLVVSGDQVARGKPAPDIYLASARHLDVAPGNCLVIEDAPNGVAAAKAAGMCCLAVSTSAGASALCRADQVVSGFADVDCRMLEKLISGDRSGPQ
jgi:HAD superfamily hydrolase (TIGR01509 family)